MALPADVQLLTRRQNSLQKQVAVVLTARSITSTPALRHEVEVSRCRLPWVVPVIHSQQTNDLEWDGAHGHQSAKLHATPKKTLVQTFLLNLRQPVVTDHLQWQGCIELGFFTSLLPRVQGF